jgi:hypothetical protein
MVRVAWFLLATAVFPVAALASVSVSIAPAVVNVPLGGQTQFVATVSGTSNSVVIWSLTGTTCSGNGCGQISSEGLYLAPSTAPASNVVTVTATSLADLTASASAAVILGSASDITVSVSPAQVTLVVGQQQRFIASVSGTTLTNVTWQLTGAGCGGSGCGTLTSDGLYTAPASVPTPATVTITATSVADPSKSGAAVVTIAPPVSVIISPAAVQVTVGTQKQFTATVSGTTNKGVSWSVAGSGCSGSACGTISTGGLYTAPSAVPTPPQISVTATAVADPTKSASASVTIVPAVAVTVSPSSAQLFISKQQQFTATVSGTSNTAVTWSVAGGCSGAACGTISTSGLYTAPSALPSPAEVTVTATSVADPTKSASATVTIEPPISVKVSPVTAQVLIGGQQQFTATVAGTSNTSVSWSLAGTGCSGSSCGTITTGGLYTAPSTIPSSPQISVTATSAADPTKSATASVTIVPPVSVTVSPATAQVVTGGHQQFSAEVAGTSNTSVLWSVAGTGCSGTACGTISTSGLYTAPSKAPTPNQVTVIATSVADSSKSGSATVVIHEQVSVAVSPAAMYVVIGGSQQFTATVSGSSNTGVSWSLAGSGCSGSACGTISPSGLYFAPPTVPTPAQVFVTATSVADSTKSGTATVTVTPPVVVSLSPTTVTLTVGKQQQFLAKVTGTTNTAIAWSVSGSGCSGASCGSITATGLYTAPASVPSSAQVTVKAASQADPDSYRSATITIIPPVNVSVSPSTAEVVAGSDYQFTAIVSGTSNPSVTWSVTGKGCTGVACGTITSTGFYGAPGKVPSPDQVTVTATSNVDSSKSSSAVVTILPPVAVAIAPLTAQVVTNGHVQFAATVSGSTNTGVIWSLSGSGCSGSACGTIGSSGLYTAPGTIPSPSQVTVKATSEADGTKSASAVVTIILPVLVAVAPTTAVVAVDGQQQFRATVAGSTNSAVDWSISGSACSGSSCGSITSAGLYTAPSTVPSLATVVVKATSQIDVSQSASAIVTLVAHQNSKLHGQYAFDFTGLNSGGVYEAAGSFTANGNGEITAGKEDVNQVLGPATNVAITGTYQVDGDNRGTMTISSSLGTQTFAFALDSTGIHGRLIEFDASGIRGSGVIEEQDATAFSLGALKGPYVLGLAGSDSRGARIGALAIFDFDGLGDIKGGSIDVNDGGTVLPTFASFQGIYRIDSTGRGILNLSIPGFEGGAFQFAFYIVSANKLLLVSTDALSSNNSIFGGTAELQSGAPYLTSSFDGATVFSLSGESSGTPQVLVGQITFDGSSQLAVEFDQNTGGTVLTGELLTGAYSLGLNGSGTLNLDDSNGQMKVWDIYAIAPNHAYVMDASSAEVGMGELKAQLTRPPFKSTDIVGTYLIGSGEPLVFTAPLYSGVVNFDGISAATGTEDISLSSTLSASQALRGNYSVSGSLNNGRGTLRLTSPSGATYDLWITSALEVLGVEVDSTNAQPVVLHLEQ